MSGVAIIGALLARHAPLLAALPAGQIKAGMLPDGIAMPALLVRLVSMTDWQPLKRSGWVRSTARVSVAVRATSYRQQGAIIRLVRDACSGFVGDIAEAERVSVLTAGLGPDVIGPGNSFEQTQDFTVRFDAALQEN